MPFFPLRMLNFFIFNVIYLNGPQFLIVPKVMSLALAIRLSVSTFTLRVSLQSKLFISFNVKIQTWKKKHTFSNNQLTSQTTSSVENSWVFALNQLTREFSWFSFTFQSTHWSCWRILISFILTKLTSFCFHDESWYTHISTISITGSQLFVNIPRYFRSINYSEFPILYTRTVINLDRNSFEQYFR